jgi:hypothetical protein
MPRYACGDRGCRPTAVPPREHPDPGLFLASPDALQCFGLLPQQPRKFPQYLGRRITFRVVDLRKATLNHFAKFRVIGFEGTLAPRIGRTFQKKTYDPQGRLLDLYVKCVGRA